MAKSWLKNNNISYTEVDVTTDKSLLEFLRSQGHRTVPQIYFNEKLLVEGGYDGLSKQNPTILKERIEKAI
jgi:glutaredoxin